VGNIMGLVPFPVGLLHGLVVGLALGLGLGADVVDGVVAVEILKRGTSVPLEGPFVAFVPVAVGVTTTTRFVPSATSGDEGKVGV